MRIKVIFALITALLFVMVASAQVDPDQGAPQRNPDNEPDKFFGKKEKKPENARSVNGYVKDARGQLVSGAVVKLKDTKTREVRSFITLEDGTFRFHGLSKEIDYELQATFKESISRTRRLSVFDNRTKATINLKLAPKEKKTS